MNCFECTIDAASVNSTAVAVCATCGAGLCLEHAHLVTLRPPTPSEWTRRIDGARRIVCPSCYAYPPSQGDRMGHVAPHRTMSARAS
jgi:hypothetical protein